ncbi:hypothetical protein BGP_1906 [Beggiatoa sp. PS]|nr:hypothetical protein BGP_1906 [Beggiatoa sp. PS]
MELNQFSLRIVSVLIFIGFGGIVGFAVGFLINQPQEQPSQQIISKAPTQQIISEAPKLDFKELQNIKELQNTVNHLKNIEQAFSELLIKYEMLSKTNNPPDNVESLNQLKEEFLSRFDMLESYLKSDRDTNQEPVPLQADIQPENCEQIYEQVDQVGIQEAIADMYSADLDTRQRALRALTLMGSSEIKQQIGQIIFNEEEDITLRNDIIKNLDWHGLSEQLIELFQISKDYNIRTAAITAAQTSHFDETERQSFESTLLENFESESDDFVKISTLDYFANNNPDKLQDFLNQEENSLSPEVHKHLQFLLVPAQEVPASEEMPEPG